VLRMRQPGGHRHAARAWAPGERAPNGAAIRPTHKRFEHGSYTCGGSEICAIVMDIKDGLPTPCERLSRRLQPMPRKGWGNFKGAAGSVSISTPRGGPTSNQRFTGCKWKRALNRDHASCWSQPRPLFVRNAKPTSVSQKRLWMFAGIFSFGFFDANADRSSGTINEHRRTR
jgi:hypothetical protein